MNELKDRNVGNCRQEIVFVGRRGWVAARVERNLLQQNHTDGLGQTSGDLPFHHRGVDWRSAVFRGYPTQISQSPFSALTSTTQAFAALVKVIGGG